MKEAFEEMEEMKAEGGYYDEDDPDTDVENGQSKKRRRRPRVKYVIDKECCGMKI